MKAIIAETRSAAEQSRAPCAALLDTGTDSACHSGCISISISISISDIKSDCTAPAPDSGSGSN